jgi:hypothetical protein
VRQSTDVAKWLASNFVASMSIESVNRIAPGNQIGPEKAIAADKTRAERAGATTSLALTQKRNAIRQPATPPVQQLNLVAIHGASRRTAVVRAKLDQQNERDHASSPATNRERVIAPTVKQNASAMRSDLFHSVGKLLSTQNDMPLHRELG